MYVITLPLSSPLCTWIDPHFGQTIRVPVDSLVSISLGFLAKLDNTPDQYIMHMNRI
jgi:hypothetical protein